MAEAPRQPGPPCPLGAEPWAGRMCTCLGHSGRLGTGRDQAPRGQAPRGSHQRHGGAGLPSCVPVTSGKLHRRQQCSPGQAVLQASPLTPPSPQQPQSCPTAKMETPRRGSRGPAPRQDACGKLALKPRSPCWASLSTKWGRRAPSPPGAGAPNGRPPCSIRPAAAERTPEPSLPPAAAGARALKGPLDSRLPPNPLPISAAFGSSGTGGSPGQQKALPERARALFPGPRLHPAGRPRTVAGTTGQEWGAAQGLAGAQDTAAPRVRGMAGVLPPERSLGTQCAAMRGGSGGSVCSSRPHPATRSPQTASVAASLEECAHPGPCSFRGTDPGGHSHLPISSDDKLEAQRGQRVAQGHTISQRGK